VTRADRLRREVAIAEGVLRLVSAPAARAGVRAVLDSKLAELAAAEDADRADAEDERTRAADLAEDAELEVAK
jgi:hypothetical protein